MCCRIMCLYVLSSLLWYFRIDTVFGSSLSPVVCWRVYVLAYYLYLFAHGDIVLCFWFVFLQLMYPMQSHFLDCPFSIAPSVLSNIFFLYSAHFFQSEIYFICVCHSYQIAKVNMFYMLFCVKLLEWLVTVMVLSATFINISDWSRMVELVQFDPT